jgi:hypothetical protein
MGSHYLKKFALPEIASRLQAEACCFSATCDWTSNKEQLPSDPNRNRWYATVFCYVIQLTLLMALGKYL